MDPKLFRQVMANWPTGVSVVTGLSTDGLPLGMVIGSFTSISLSPPLVGFFVKSDSATWQAIEAQGGRFCVNVLHHRQAALCSTFSTGEPAHRFDHVEHTPGPSGRPHIVGCCAWIDACCDKVVQLGDHILVLGRVLDMQTGADALPLVFAKGRLHRPEALHASSDEHIALWETSLREAQAIGGC